MQQPRVAVYVRVSTDGQTYESQSAELIEYCTRRGWDNVEWYRDTASGAQRDRQGLNELMHKVRRGKVDIILAFKLDRIARSLGHLAQVLGELQFHRVALICPSQGIETSSSNAASTFQVSVLAAVAQFERELIVERVRAGIAAAKARGVRLGRPATPDKKKRQVVELLQRGLKARAIAEHLRMPYSTVTEVIRESRQAG